MKKFLTFIAVIFAAISCSMDGGSYSQSYPFDITFEFSDYVYTNSFSKDSLFVLTEGEGFIYGNYSSMMDVVVSTGRTFVLFVPAMMALVPASGIVPCMQYIGLKSIFSVSLEVVTAILYMLPFVYIMLLEMNEQ